MKRILLCFCLILSGCARHVAVQPPTADLWEGPFFAQDRSYAYYTKGHSEWVVISKTGPQKAVKDLCPKDVVCLTEDIGQTYHIQRGN